VKETKPAESQTTPAPAAIRPLCSDAGLDARPLATPFCERSSATEDAGCQASAPNSTPVSTARATGGVAEVDDFIPISALANARACVRLDKSVQTTPAATAHAASQIPDDHYAPSAAAADSSDQHFAELQELRARVARGERDRAELLQAVSDFEAELIDLERERDELHSQLAARQAYSVADGASSHRDPGEPPRPSSSPRRALRLLSSPSVRTQSRGAGEISLSLEARDEAVMAAPQTNSSATGTDRCETRDASTSHGVRLLVDGGGTLTEPAATLHHAGTSTDVTSSAIAELLTRAPSPTRSVGTSAVQSSREQSVGEDPRDSSMTAPQAKGPVLDEPSLHAGESSPSPRRSPGSIDSFTVRYSRSSIEMDDSASPSSRTAILAVPVEGGIDDTPPPPRHSPGPRVGAPRTVSPPRGVRGVLTSSPSSPAGLTNRIPPPSPDLTPAETGEPEHRSDDAAVTNFMFMGVVTELVQDEALGRLKLSMQQDRDRQTMQCSFIDTRGLLAHATGHFLDEKTPAKNSTGFVAPANPVGGIAYRTPTPGRTRPAFEGPADSPSTPEAVLQLDDDDSDGTPDEIQSDFSVSGRESAAHLASDLSLNARPALTTQDFLARARLADSYHEGAFAIAEAEAVSRREMLLESHRRALDIQSLEQEITMQLRSSAASAGVETSAAHPHTALSGEESSRMMEIFHQLPKRDSMNRPALERGQSPVDSTKQRFNVQTTLIPGPTVYVGPTRGGSSSRLSASMLEMHAERRMSGASITGLLERMRQDSSFHSANPVRHAVDASQTPRSRTAAGGGARSGSPDPGNLALRVRRIASAVSRVDERPRRK
jgi:hypothetical protein